MALIEKAVLESLFQDFKRSGVSTYLEHGGGFSPRFPNQSEPPDYHIDRLGVGKTPSKRRKTSHEELFKICSEYSDYSSKLDYLFAVAKHFGHDLE